MSSSQSYTVTFPFERLPVEVQPNILEFAASDQKSAVILLNAFRPRNTSSYVTVLQIYYRTWTVTVKESNFSLLESLNSNAIQSIHRLQIKIRSFS